MLQTEALDQDEIAKIEEFVNEFTGDRFLLPNDKNEQKEIVERAVFWLLSGMYPNTAEIASLDEDVRLFMEDVEKEAKKKAEEFFDYKLSSNTPWEAAYDYWHSRFSIATVKKSVTVTNSEKIPNPVLRIGSVLSGERFVCDGLVGLSEKAFEPIQTAIWERKEPDARLKADGNSRIEALNDLKTVVTNLGFDFDTLSKQMHDLALFDYYANLLGYDRVNNLLKDYNNGEIKDGEYITTISKYIDGFWEKLTEDEKATISGQEQIIFVAKARTKQDESVESFTLTTGVNISLGNVPCRIDEKGVFTLDLNNSSSYQVETYSNLKQIDKDTTPSKLAKVKMTLRKKSSELTSGTNTSRARFKVE